MDDVVAKEHSLAPGAHKRKTGWGTVALCLLLGAGCVPEFGKNMPRRPKPPAAPGVGNTPVEIIRKDGKRLVRHACGETIIPEQPRRVLAFALADPMFFLGLKPVAQAGIWDWATKGHYLNPYLEGVGHVGGVYGGRMPNVESALSFRPDLILLNTINAQTYQRMRCVAPTVVLDARTSAASKDRQRTLDVGKLCGVETRAHKAVLWYERKRELAKAALHREIGDERIGVMWFFVKQLRLYNCSVLYEDLQLQPPSLLNLDPRTFLGVTVLNLERLGDYDADHMFVIWADNPRRNFNLDNVKRFPLWNRIPAVRTGQIFHVSVSNWAGAGILGHSKVMTEFVQALVPRERCSAELESYLKDRPSDEDLGKIKLPPNEKSASHTQSNRPHDPRAGALWRAMDAGQSSLSVSLPYITGGTS